jgi:5-methylcytosine-specific restriction endonuclease McrA
MMLKSCESELLCTDNCKDCNNPHFYAFKKVKPINTVSKKKTKEKSIEEKLKDELLELFEGNCMKCGQRPDYRGLSLHHLKHKSQGGKSVKSNVTLVCGKCHSEFHGVKEV